MKTTLNKLLVITLIFFSGGYLSARVTTTVTVDTLDSQGNPNGTVTIHITSNDGDSFEDTANVTSLKNRIEKLSKSEAFKKKMGRVKGHLGNNAPIIVEAKNNSSDVKGGQAATLDTDGDGKADAGLVQMDCKDFGANSNQPPFIPKPGHGLSEEKLRKFWDCWKDMALAHELDHLSGSKDPDGFGKTGPAVDCENKVAKDLKKKFKRQAYVNLIGDPSNPESQRRGICFEFCDQEFYLLFNTTSAENSGTSQVQKLVISHEQQSGLDSIPSGPNEYEDVGGNDQDLDGVLDLHDNCQRIFNPQQADDDRDGLGTACDPDEDGDGIHGEIDNCRFMVNPNQIDTDGDGQGDACDTDDDGDEIADYLDNCPTAQNPNQEDRDGNGIGDACDQEEDTDGDGVSDSRDNCAQVNNPLQVDTDGDGQGDACDEDADGDEVIDISDNCPFNFNPNQLDVDDDGLGDACDTDRDGDDLTDDFDNCPGHYNPSQSDQDDDGIGDACDTDAVIDPGNEIEIEF